MDFAQLLTAISTGIFEPLTVLIVSLALLYFLLGVLKYIQSVDNEEKRKEGATMITYGLVALFVMGAVWGLVNVIQSTFPDLDSDTPIKPPSLTGSSNAPAGSSFGSSPSPTDLGPWTWPTVV